MSIRVLLVDDEHMIRAGFAMILGAQPDIEVVGEADDGESAIAQTRRVPAGTPVSYAGTFVTARPSTIGTLPVGYADGYHRLASNRASVIVRGRRAPVAGRVCMDHTMIDLTDVPGAETGDPVVLFGDGVGADELAGWCETIPYEMLTAVGKRVPRLHMEEFDG